MWALKVVWEQWVDGNSSRGNELRLNQAIKICKQGWVTDIFRILSFQQLDVWQKMMEAVKREKLGLLKSSYIRVCLWLPVPRQFLHKRVCSYCLTALDFMTWRNVSERGTCLKWKQRCWQMQVLTINWLWQESQSCHTMMRICSTSEISFCLNVWNWHVKWKCFYTIYTFVFLWIQITF